MEALFTRGLLSDFLREKQAEAIDAVRRQTILSSSQDDAALIERIVNDHTPCVPTVHWDQSQWSTEDTLIPPEKVRHLMNATSPVPGTAYVWRVPFEGDPALFRYKPNSFTTVFPRARVEKGCLIFRFEYPSGGMSEEELAQLVEQHRSYQRALVDDYLLWVREQVKQYREQLIREVSDALARRKQELAQRQSVLDRLQQGTARQEERDPGSTPSP
ncbi:MAG: hypothetical protein NZ761_03190 [Dehalococcoidia bacterium]|nr:hypothetical protein [Dehalococcoidia bacterium]